MTKLTLLAVLGLIYLGVLRLAYFFMAVFIILFFECRYGIDPHGQTAAKHPFAAQ